MEKVSLEQIRDKAVTLAQERGWNVDPAQCRVDDIADDASVLTGQYTHWKVTMPLDPNRNPHRPLSRKYNLTADVRLLSNGGLLADLSEPPAVLKARMREEDAY